jgi:hypothetical protein
MPTISIHQRMLLAALTPCSLITVNRLVQGETVRPAIAARIREVAAEQKITLPAAPRAKAVRV